MPSPYFPPLTTALPGRTGLSLLALILGSVPLSAGAQTGNSPVQIGTVTLSGNGCTANKSAQVSLAPDSKAVSVIFDGFEAEVGSRAGVRMARATCSLQIPLSMAQGTQVAIHRADVRGYNQLANRAYAQFTTTYSLNGQSMPTILRRLVGPINTDFTSINQLRAQDIKWSPCGGSAVINVLSSIVVQANAQNETSLSSVDSMDLRRGPSEKAVELQILTRACNE